MSHHPVVSRYPFPQNTRLEHLCYPATADVRDVERTYAAFCKEIVTAEGAAEAEQSKGTKGRKAAKAESEEAQAEAVGAETSGEPAMDTEVSGDGSAEA